MGISLFEAPAGGIFVRRPRKFQAGSLAVNVKVCKVRPKGREACPSASLQANTGIKSKATRTGPDLDKGAAYGTVAGVRDVAG